MNTNIVFLYSRLAGYFVANINSFARENTDYTIYIVQYQSNNEAPYKFNFEKNIIVKNKSFYNRKTLFHYVSNLAPKVLIVSGWFDKDYSFIAEKLKKQKINTVCTIDNFYIKSIRQRIALIPLKLYLKKRFSNAWVPGIRQFSYAHRLGFNYSHIHLGFYSADKHLFNDRPLKHAQEEKTILYAGRLVKYKWVDEFINAFIELSDNYPNWNLLIVGNGPLAELLPKHNRIKYLKFIQPQKLPELAKKCSVFALPSIHENYGVTVHEFTSLGKPILCSDNVGAQTDFVIDNYNGWVFKAGNKDSLKDSLQHVFETDKATLKSMMDNSYLLSQKYNIEIWSKTLSNLIHQNL